MRFWQTVNPVSLLLLPIAWLFCLLVQLRRQWYLFNAASLWKSPVPVIVVGNICVGGTGKTPVVLALVEFLKSCGYKPGVVSRGYGGRKSPSPLLLEAETPAEMAGDEPVLIYQRTQVPVCVHSDRSLAVQHLLEQHGCDVVVTDDGLQHYRLPRDFEIAVVDAVKLHGNGFCLPAGPLREPESRLQEMDFVLYNRQDRSQDESSFSLSPEAFVSLTGYEQPISYFDGQAVHAVAGTASPNRFFATLRSLGVEPIESVFPDHHAFCLDDFASLKDKPIVMTEKDAVKCADFGLENAWFLRVDAKLPELLQARIKQIMQNHNPDRQHEPESI